MHRMRRIIWYGLIGSLAGAWVAGCASPEGPRVRVATWNIHATSAGADVIADELRRLDPDVICLQEIESGVLESPGPDQAQAIARLLGMNHVVTPVPEPGSRHEQIGVFAKGELRDPTWLRVGEGRYYGIEVEYAPWHDQRIRLMAVHLSSTDWSSIGSFFASNARRMQDVEDLVGRLRGERDPLILTGDFNVAPGMLEHLILSLNARWVTTFEPTFPSHRPLLQLDHVFLKGSLRPDRIFAVPTAASDHRILVADIILTGRPNPLVPAVPIVR